MVRSQVRAQANAERCYRLLSCPGSAAAAVAAEQLGAALAAEQLAQPDAKGAARQPTAAAARAAALSAAIAAAERAAAAVLAAAAKRAVAPTQQQQIKGPNTFHCKIIKLVVPIKGKAPPQKKKFQSVIDFFNPKS